MHIRLWYSLLITELFALLFRGFSEVYIWKCMLYIPGLSRHYAQAIIALHHLHGESPMGGNHAGPSQRRDSRPILDWSTGFGGSTYLKLMELVNDIVYIWIGQCGLPCLYAYICHLLSMFSIKRLWGTGMDGENGIRNIADDGDIHTLTIPLAWQLASCHDLIDCVRSTCPCTHSCLHTSLYSWLRPAAELWYNDWINPIISSFNIISKVQHASLWTYHDNIFMLLIHE